MKLFDSKYKDIIGEYFNYSFDFKFLDIVASLIDRLDSYNEQEVFDEVDNCLSFYDNEWIIARFYNLRPHELSYNDYIDPFLDDMLNIVNIIVKG